LILCTIALSGIALYQQNTINHYEHLLSESQIIDIWSSDKYDSSGQLTERIIQIWIALKENSYDSYSYEVYPELRFLNHSATITLD
jgi:hypothetical protein